MYFATEWRRRLASHPESHVGYTDRAACWCESLAPSANSPKKHYRCRFCFRVYDSVTRVESHDVLRAPKADLQESKIGIVGKPSVADAFQWYSDRLVKPDMFASIAPSPLYTMIRNALGIRGRLPAPGEIEFAEAWRRVFQAEDLKVDVGAPTQILAIYDTSPTVWVARCTEMAHVRQFALSEEVCFIPMVGFFTLQFALNAWSIYMDSLNVEQLRRSILSEWGSYVRNSLAAGRCARPTQFDWVLGAVPTAHALKKIPRKTRSIQDSWRRELEDTLAIIDGGVIRTDGHFKPPRKIIMESGRPSKTTLAVLGSNGYLPREVFLTESESADSYIRAISPILAKRYAYGLPPSRVISDNPGVLQGEIRGVISEIRGRDQDFLLA